jgi:iron(III) transport system ATP-binding protein
MSGLEIRGLVKRYPGKGRGSEPVLAVDDFSLEVPRGVFFTVLGPSGCGKTTTLRCVAGLEKPEVGEILVDGRLLFSATSGANVRASRRGLGMVFQSFAVWPHMSVYENVAFPLVAGFRRRRIPRRLVRERVERVLAAVQLEDFSSRPATDVSGGQQQRLALARALVMEPPLLLLDEPLSNLDAPLRQQMRFEIKRLQSETGITAVYVTHDQHEALALSDVVGVMRAGRLEQVGSPREVYERPISRFVADFIGAANLIDGEAEHLNGSGVWSVRTSQGSLQALAGGDIGRGSRVSVVVRPEQLGLELATDRAEANGWRGTVEAPAFLGNCVDYVVRVGELTLRARSGPQLTLAPGTNVVLTFPTEPFVLLGS